MKFNDNNYNDMMIVMIMVVMVMMIQTGAKRGRQTDKTQTDGQTYRQRHREIQQRL